MLLLAMISLHMLTFRLMVTMVAEFCQLVILIHNTLLGEIMISSTWTTRVNGKNYLYSLSCNNTFPHAKIQDHWFCVHWGTLLQKKKKKKMKNMDKFNVEIIFSDIMYILHYNTTNFCILVIFHTFFSLISLKVRSTSNWKWKWTKSLYMVFNGDRP